MSPKRILIVDDNRIILKAFSLKLQASGYEVHTAEDGASAVGLVRQNKPDLIVLDINFPPDVGHGGGVGWDGFLILDWLHRMDEAKDIPVVVITGGDPAKYKDRALAAGAASFLHKPIKPEELVSAVRQALGEDTRTPAPPTPTPS
jgi:CheY-like chemotaxis protein